MVGRANASIRIETFGVDGGRCGAQGRGMKEGPDIARVASLIGDPARAGMLVALMSGKALSAGELAREAGVTPATASSHLKKMQDGGLLRPRKQGRHRYYALRNEDVGRAVEALSNLLSIFIQGYFTNTVC